MNEQTRFNDYELSTFCKSGKNCKNCYLKNACNDKPKNELEALREENKKLKEMINKIYVIIVNAKR